MKRYWPQHLCVRARARSLAPRKPWPGYRALLSAALAGAMLLSAVAGESETAASRGNDVPAVALGPFHRFLADPPWIKYVRFKRSGNQEPSMALVTGGKDHSNPSPWAIYEGALQPRGFFLRHLEHTSLYYRPTPSGGLVYEPPKPGEEWIVGANSRWWWQLDEKNGMVNIAPREPEPGHSPTNGPEIIAQGQQERLLEVLRCLGMPELVDAVVEWLDATRFQATSWQHGKLEGAITRWRDDLVEELEYQVTRPAKRRVLMRYAYSPQMRMPPVEMVRTVVEGEVIHSYTNVIVQWDVGIDPQHPEGFAASEWRQQPKPLDFFLVWSNGVRFKMARDGSLVRVDEEALRLDPVAALGRLARPAWQDTLHAILAGAGILLGALLWGIWRVRRNKQTKG